MITHCDTNSQRVQPSPGVVGGGRWWWERQQVSEQGFFQELGSRSYAGKGAGLGDTQGRLGHPTALLNLYF